MQRLSEALRFGPSGFTRTEREMVATVVSKRRLLLHQDRGADGLGVELDDAFTGRGGKRG
jgi:hypothetical protein